MAHTIAEVDAHHHHSLACGHTKLLHGDHVDYLENGHLHHPHEDHFDEAVIPVSANNPDGESPVVEGELHDEYCGHEQVPHGDHIDYLVNGRLLHVHGDHVDDHGPVDVVN